MRESGIWRWPQRAAMLQDASSKYPECLALGSKKDLSDLQNEMMLRINHCQHLDELVGAKSVASIAQDFAHDAFVYSYDFRELFSLQTMLAFINDELPAKLKTKLLKGRSRR